MDKQKTIQKYTVFIAMIAAMLLTMSPTVTAENYTTDVFQDTMGYLDDIAKALEDEDADGDGGEIRRLILAAFGIILFICVFVLLFYIMGWVPSLFDIDNIKKLFRSKR